VDIQAYIQSGIIESYVLGLASAEETSEVESLALQHPEIQHAINQFADLLEEEAMQNAVAPPTGLKDRIMQAINEDDERNVAVPVMIASPTSTSAASFTRQSDGVPVVPVYKKSVRIWQFAATASIILFVVSASYNFYLYNQYSDKKEQYQALLLQRNSLQASNDVYQTKLRDWQSASDMMADPAMAMIKMAGVKGKEITKATLFWDTRSKDVYVMANKLPAPVANKQYQLWAIVDGKPVDAGMIDPTCTSVCKMKNIPRAEMFAITLENVGGSPAPTMEQMFVAGKV
jgi:anti-sigma-K factor RskA